MRHRGLPGLPAKFIHGGLRRVSVKLGIQQLITVHGTFVASRCASHPSQIARTDAVATDHGGEEVCGRPPNDSVGRDEQ